MLNSSLSSFLTKKSSPPTQYLIFNKKVNENDDTNDETKKGRSKGSRIEVGRGGEKIKVFDRNIYQCQKVNQ